MGGEAKLAVHLLTIRATGFRCTCLEQLAGREN